MARLGIIAGLRSEALLLSATETGNNHVVLVAGADPDRARVLAEQAVSRGAEGLVSFGLAGGVDPSLSCGDVLVPETVVFGGESWPTDDRWRQRLDALLSGEFRVLKGLLAGSACVLSSPAHKVRLHEATAASAVDMESHMVAGVAARHGIPFVVLRVVADPAAQEVPPWLLRGIGTDGQVKPVAVIGGLLSQPSVLPKLIRLAGYNRRSLSVLRRVALLVGPDFAFGEFGG